MTSYKTIVNFIRGEVSENTRIMDRAQQLMSQWGVRYDDSGAFGPTQALIRSNLLTGSHTICLGPTLTQRENVCGIMALLHELGHFIDFDRMGVRGVRETYGVLEMEIRAWEHAFRIARLIGFNDPDYYEVLAEYALSCLWTYFKHDPSDYKKRGGITFEGVAPCWWEAQQRIEKALKKTKKGRELAYA